MLTAELRQPVQTNLFPPTNKEILTSFKFPQTRYQGSKLKLINKLEQIFKTLNFNTCLDAFGGTGAVSYSLKKLEKSVTYNDNMKFNLLIGKALIENNAITISKEDIQKLYFKDSSVHYRSIIQNNFKNIYYLDHENEWLDVVIQNIRRMNNDYKKAIAYWALFQACLSKRPYNLFHRKNLYVRTSEVKRTFGNKTTWDKPFKEHFENFIKQANKAVFDNGKNNSVLNEDAVKIKNIYDLVYIDTPYIPTKGSITNYYEFYHFLEGLSNYDTWENMIDYDSKHRRLRPVYNPWYDKNNIRSEFNKLIEQFKKSIIVISYRKDGIPSIEEITDILEKNGKKVKVDSENYKYALSIKMNVKEAIIIAE